MARDSLPRAARKAAIIEEHLESDPSSESESESDSDESEVAPVYAPPAKKEKSLTPAERLRRTIEQLPREALNELLFDVAENERLVTPAELEHALNSILRKGLLQFPVEILVQIVSLLPIRDRVLCLRTCRFLRELGETQPSIWKTVVFAKVPRARNERDPNAWIRKSTVSEVMANLPKRSVRVLSVDFNFINKTALNSLVYQHPLVELNLIGPKGFSTSRFFRGLKLPSLRVLRAFEIDPHEINGPVADFLDAHPKITTLGSCHTLLPNQLWPRKPRPFHKRIARFEMLRILPSFDSFVGLLDSFTGLKELSIETLRYDRINVLRAGMRDTLEEVQECNERPKFWRTAVMAAWESKRGPSATPTMVRIGLVDWQGVEEDEPANLPWLVDELCRGRIEHLDLGFPRKLVLNGTFPALRILELQQMHYGDGPKTPKAAALRRWTLSTDGSLAAIFSGFSAPNLERLIVHGQGGLKVEDFRPFVPEGVEICVTGRKREMVGYEDVEWKNYM